MSDLDPRVQELLDRDEIRNLTFLYCHYVWQKDMRIVDLFTEDGGFNANAQQPERAVRGKQALLAEYSRILDTPAPPLPFIHNHVIEFHGSDDATGFCYLDVRTAPEGSRTFGMAFYNDTYKKVAGRWKFQKRLVNFVASARVTQSQA